MAANKLGYALITNARIIDGSGKEPYTGNVLIKDNRIDSILNDVKDLSLSLLDEAFVPEKSSQTTDTLAVQ